MGQLKSPRKSFEQFQVPHFLDVLDLMTDRTLGDVQFLSSLGEAEMARRGGKGSQRSDGGR